MAIYYIGSDMHKLTKGLAHHLDIAIMYSCIPKGVVKCNVYVATLRIICSRNISSISLCILCRFTELNELIIT